MEEKKNFEAIFKEDLYQYLLSIDKVDAHCRKLRIWKSCGRK